ncbi:MAG: Helix-turn-helix domain [Firmicutes bacterium]|nr:Helix-turn-helix domain [Bacillota bacterium]
MNFGNKIRDLRLKTSKTQKLIEAETAIPQRTLSDWENNKSEPTLSDAIKLAEAFGVSINQLIGESD